MKIFLRYFRYYSTIKLLNKVFFLFFYLILIFLNMVDGGHEGHVESRVLRNQAGDLVLAGGVAGRVRRQTSQHPELVNPGGNPAAVIRLGEVSEISVFDLDIGVMGKEGCCRDNGTVVEESGNGLHDAFSEGFRGAGIENG